MGFTRGEAGVIIGIIGAAIAGVGEVLGWVFGHINCDGMVLSNVISTNGNAIRGWMNPAGMHTESRNYAGPRYASRMRLRCTVCGQLVDHTELRRNCEPKQRVSPRCARVFDARSDPDPTVSDQPWVEPAMADAS